MEVLVVDGANVVGSRPDGWWRDREGAARRLWARLAVAELPYDEVVLVLEGAARRGVAPSAEPGRAVVHAPTDGDDAVMDQVRERSRQGGDVTVVTADRGLRARAAAAGARLLGPSWLLERI